MFPTSVKVHVYTYTAQLEQIVATSGLLWVCEWTPRPCACLAGLILHIMNAPHFSATSIASFIIISRPPATAFPYTVVLQSGPQICAVKDLLLLFTFLFSCSCDPTVHIGRAHCFVPWPGRDMSYYTTPIIILPCQKTSLYYPNKQLYSTFLSHDRTCPQHRMELW